jgi:protein-L-isoaspartate(D-aspartate) O-methyltransferase
MNFAVARRNMVDSQIRTNRVTDPDLIAALLDVPRERFVPASLRGVAYVDEDIPLGGGRFVIEPMVGARLLQEAAVRPGDRVLVVGCGTGYLCAVLCRFARAVVGLESDKALAAMATAVLGDLGATNVSIVCGRLRDGRPGEAPFDVIVIEGTVLEIPDSVLAQLAEGGRLVTVVNRDGVGRATLAVRTGGALSRRVLFDATPPGLPGFEMAPDFAF